MADQVTPESCCPWCGQNQQHAYPKAGDYTVCIKCGRVLVFAKNLTVRKPNAEETRRLSTSTRLRRHVERIRRTLQEVGSPAGKGVASPLYGCMGSITDSAVVGKRPVRAWRIVLGAILVLVAPVNRAILAPAAWGAYRIGSLVGLLVVVGLAAWLISSGLPRSIGNQDLVRTRRRIWYLLAGLGLFAMTGLAVLLARFSFVTAAVNVFRLFWFGWTWVAWLIADKQAVRQAQAKERPL